MLEILTLALGLISSTTLVASALSTDRHRLLLLSLITNLLVVTQFALTGAQVGLAVGLVTSLRTAVALLGYRYPQFNHWVTIPFFGVLLAGAFVLANDWSHVELYNFIPFVASLTSIIAMFFKNLIYTKSLLLLTGCLWLYYEFVTGVYTHMIGETITQLCNIIALVWLIQAARKGVKVIDPIGEALQAIKVKLRRAPSV